MLDDFLVRATIAAIGVALICAPLGCFVTWRRMAYFGEATSHAAILGVALGLWMNVSIVVAVLGVAIAGALLFQNLKDDAAPSDSLLGVMSHSGLAIGLVMIALTSQSRLDPTSFLFGDILAIGSTDLLLIWGGGALICLVVALRWSSLILSTLNPDLARAAGHKPERDTLIFTLCVAVLVAVALKVVGALLITAMLIIPPAAARPFARSPETMVGVTAVIGVVSVASGLWVSLTFDTPAGPSVVSMAAMIFAAAQIIRTLRA